jgi:hypothetical protein
MASAVKISVAFGIIGLLCLVASALGLDGKPARQQLGFALSTALITTAALGLIYEVWLRTEIESSTLQKVNLSADIGKHGLVKIVDDQLVDWEDLITGNQALAVYSRDPETLLGRSRDKILGAAARGELNRLVLGVPESSWDDAERWLKEVVESWREKAPGAEIQCVCVSGHNAGAYELVSDGRRSHLLLPRFFEDTRYQAHKGLIVEESATTGLGAWLSDQIRALEVQSARLGYAPNAASQPHEADDDAEPEETLT